MAKKKAPTTEWSDLYRKSFESTLALWPFFFIRIAYSVLAVGLFLACFVIGFWPLFRFFIEHWHELINATSPEVFNQFDWSASFTDPKGLALMGSSIAFYITGSLFTSAFFDSAYYRQLKDYQENDEKFSWKAFWEKGVQYTLPMVLMLLAWMVLFILYMVLSLVTVLLVGYLLKFLSFFLLFLAIPAGFAWFLFTLCLSVAWVMSGAYLVDGNGVWGSITKSVAAVLRHGGRIFWIVLIMIILGFVFYVAFSVVFAGLSLLPWVGFLFDIVRAVVGLVMTVGFYLYLAALCMTLMLEAKDTR